MSRRRALVAVSAVTVLVAVVVAPFASGAPDGLEKVAEDEGFVALVDDHALDGSPVADYVVQGVGDDRVATGLAGLLGVLLILVGTVVLARLLGAGRREAEGT